MSDVQIFEPTETRSDSQFQRALKDAQGAFAQLAGQEEHLLRAASLCADALRSGNKLLVCGNGGSAAEAQHLVGELMGRYKGDRASLPAIALNVDAVTLTCIGNDYRFEEIFSRQFSALATKQDVLIVFSTSGNSKNILEVLRVAKTSQIGSIGFLGRDGGEARDLVHVDITILRADTARIQECHQFLMHCLMDHIEEFLAR